VTDAPNIQPPGAIPGAVAAGRLRAMTGGHIPGDSAFSWGQAERDLTDRIDTTVPHSARVWNYWLGGKDHYQVDRDAGRECQAIFPGMADTIRALRYFTARAVRHLAAEEGVRQFLDIGCGLPFTDPVHQVAQDAAPGCRIVYADNDPLVLAHAQALLTGPSGTVAHIDGDLRDMATVIDRATGMLDFTQPVAVLLVSVLGHLSHPGEHEREGAGLAVATLRDALPPGGFLAVADLTAHPELDTAMSYYASTGAAPYHPRPPEEIAGFLDSLEVTDLGVVPVTRWRPEHDPFPALDVPAWGGLGRKAQPAQPVARDAGSHAPAIQAGEHSPHRQDRRAARPSRHSAALRR
jgi:SAM-dependent methyltransferase